MKHYIALILCVSLCVSALPASAQSAQTISFDANNIISDSDFFNADDMPLADIQSFLEKKGSSLARYTAVDIDGQGKRASAIISRAAHEYGINPKILLVLLQKEQSLIENPSPTQYNYDWATGFARCDSCLATDARVIAYRGFTLQVDRAAWRKVYYTTHPEQFNFRMGTPAIIDGQNVIPENKATAALYNYTPHIHGNFNFWKLWVRYFGKFYPDGTVVQEENHVEIWLIQNGRRRLFTSMSAFLSRYSLSQIVSIGSNDLATYPEDTPIRFAQYSLLQSPKGAVFLYADDLKYGIPSRAIFRKIGFNPEEVIPVADVDLSVIPTGGLITEPTMNPVGDLYQNAKTGGIYYVQRGIKHPILEKIVLRTNFPYRKPKRVLPKDLELLQTGDPVQFPEGTLVTAPGGSAVYIISNGTKRPFASAEAFTSLGFKWSEILTTSGKTLDTHPLGDVVDIGRTYDVVEPTIALK